MADHLHQTPRSRSLACAVILAILALAALPAGVLLAQPAIAPFTVTETGKGYGRLQDAVDAIGGRQGAIAIAPGHYAQCAAQSAGDISYVAREPGSVVFDGRICEGKAALVLRGRSAKVSGLIFRNMSADDGNGAGIRVERGNLSVVQSWFRDSEQGILSGNDPSGRILVDKSTFTNLGTCAYSGGCAHSIYVGDYGTVRITRSRFERGHGGHYVKSRAARIEIASSSFDDAAGHATNYMIDLPNGATGQISNNWFVQGRDKENHSAFIAIAAEGRRHSSEGLKIIGNNARFAPSVERKSAFVADWSGDRLMISGNRIGPDITPFVRH